MSKSLVLFVSFMLLVGCSNQGKQAKEKEVNVSESAIISALEDVTMDVDGIYYLYDKDGKPEGFSPDKPLEHSKKFKGNFKNIEITDMSKDKDSNDLIVTFNAGIENEFYKTEKSHQLQTRCSVVGDTIRTETPTIIDDSPIFVSATIPFKTDYFYDNYPITTQIEYLIKGNTVIENKSETVDFTRENVTNIELYDYRSTSEFLIQSNIRVTLANGLVLRNSVNLTYSPKENVTESKQWNIKYNGNRFFIE